jgi:hypothetical protein
VLPPKPVGWAVSAGVAHDCVETAGGGLVADLLGANGDSDAPVRFENTNDEATLPIVPAPPGPVAVPDMAAGDGELLV